MTISKLCWLQHLLVQWAVSSLTEIKWSFLVIISLSTDGLWGGEQKISTDWDPDWDFNINCLNDNEVTGLKYFRRSESQSVSGGLITLHHSALLDNDFSPPEITYKTSQWGTTFSIVKLELRLRWHCLNILLAMTIIAEYYNGGCGWHFLSWSILEWQGYQNNIRGWLGTDSGWHSLHNDI